MGGSEERERGMGEWRRAVEKGDGEGSETGSVTEEGGEKIDDRYRCQPHPGLG